MDWSQVLYTGLGGGAGAALGAFIALGINKKIKNTKYHSGIRAAFAGGLAVLGMNFTKSMYADMQLPRGGTSVEATLLEASPNYVEMKKYEPEYFEKIMKTVDMSVRENSDEATIINEDRAVFIQLLADKVKYADGDTLSVMMKIARQNYLDFKQNKPYLCVLAINQRGVGDVNPYVSAKSKKLEQEYILKMIRLPRKDIKVVDKVLAKKSEEAMTLAILNQYPSGVIMDLPEGSEEEKMEKICDIGAAMVANILALPEPERSNYIRSGFGK